MRRRETEVRTLEARILELAGRVSFLKAGNGDPREIARLNEEITRAVNKIEKIQREERSPA